VRSGEPGAPRDRLNYSTADAAASWNSSAEPANLKQEYETSDSMAPVVQSQRDLRLDLFRGLALWLIFLDHIPHNVVSWITLRNYGFSDAAEIFVFISGYTAAFVYARAMRERGFTIAAIRILKRVWQLYVAHIFLFLIFMAEIAYLARSFENPLYAEEMNIVDFLRDPEVTLVEALLLKFKPVNMDILPVYIALLAGFPPILWLLLRVPVLALAASVGLYTLAYMLHWNVAAYPSGHWVINPFCWQLLFVFGAWCGLYPDKLAGIIRSRIALAVAAAYLLFAFAIVMTWYMPPLVRFIPQWLHDFMYPIDKTNQDVLRLAHFMALALFAARFVPSGWSALHSPWLRPAIRCGQHSLEIFCLGIFLSFAGHFMVVEISGRIVMQLAVSVVGVGIMIATAALLTWYQETDKRSRDSRERLADGDIAGGA
jgi:hypothetical protein